MDFCKKLDSLFDTEVQFASVSGRPNKGNLMLEFKLELAEKAREIRKAFAQKRIANTLPGYDRHHASYKGQTGNHEGDHKKD